MLNKTISRRDAAKLAGATAAVVAIPALTLKASGSLRVEGGSILQALADSIASTSQAVTTTNALVQQASLKKDTASASALQHKALQQEAKIRILARQLANLKPANPYEKQNQSQALQIARGHLSFV